MTTEAMTTQEEVDLLRSGMCHCAVRLAKLLREDAVAYRRSLSLTRAVNEAKGILHDDPSLHECDRRRPS